MNKYSQLESVPKGVEPVQEQSEKKSGTSLSLASTDSPAEVEVEESKSSKSKKQSGNRGHTRPLQSSVIRETSL